jgi:S-adenosylmethionine hydrolase
VDHYGNLVTDIPWAWLPEVPCRVEVESHATNRRVTHYAEIPPGEAAFLPGSLGTVEVSKDGENLAREWHAGRGATVRIALEKG